MSLTDVRSSDLHCCVAGENAHRGAALGALLAANIGVPDHWKTGLQQAHNIDKLTKTQS